MLAVWAVAGVYMHTTDQFSENGGARWALAGLMGMSVPVVVGIRQWVASLWNRRTRGPRAADRHRPRGEA
jgi:hypothetical protein